MKLRAGPGAIAHGKRYQMGDARGIATGIVAVVLALVSASIAFFVLTFRRRWLLQELRRIEIARKAA